MMEGTSGSLPGMVRAERIDGDRRARPRTGGARPGRGVRERRWPRPAMPVGDREDSLRGRSRAMPSGSTSGRRATEGSPCCGRRASACPRRGRGARSSSARRGRSRRAAGGDGCSRRTSRPRPRRGASSTSRSSDVPDVGLAARRALRRRRSVESDMRRVTPASPSARKRIDVDVLSVGRGLVELEVSGVDDGARRSSGSRARSRRRWSG